ncbi:hypothetical protein BH09BAC6_BH09BAC6_17660 [soil metagenome]|jgi:glycerophosphoryl diester phosphodiesterase
MKLVQLLPVLFILLFGTQHRPNPVPVMKHKFVVIAHRGDHTIYPENTLEAYARAIKNDADYVEVDLRTTKDGKLVSMHDATLNRMTDGKGLVKDLTLNEIENLRINVKNKPDSTLYKVPTFEQILKLCKNKIHIYIDFKEADASATFIMLKKYGMEKQVLVYINKLSQIADWRGPDPKMPLMMSLPGTAKNKESLLQFVNEYHPDVLDGGYKSYNAEMVLCAGKLGIPIWPDIQGPGENSSEWDMAVALGLKGLQTDNPYALVKYLTEKGLR